MSVVCGFTACHGFGDNSHLVVVTATSYWGHNKVFVITNISKSSLVENSIENLLVNGCGQGRKPVRNVFAASSLGQVSITVFYRSA